MQENNRTLLKSSMFYGLLLGGFWVVKYIFFIIGTFVPAFDSVSVILAPLTCVFAYMFTKVYKIREGGRISFARAWRFGVALFFFAALIEALPQYIYFHYLAPPDFIDQMLKQANVLADMMTLAPETKSAVMQQMSGLRPIDLALQGIMTSIFYGIIISIPVAALLCRGVETIKFNREQEDE